MPISGFSGICPYCYNPFGTYTDDPLDTPNHPNVNFQGIVTLRERHITEIRTAVNLAEQEAGISPQTTWSEISDVGISRIQIINEIRIAIENILTALGVTLSDWLSTAADGTLSLPTQPSWLDGVSGTSGQSGNRLQEGALVRGMHLEQLRKVLPLSVWDTYTCQTAAQALYPALTNSASTGQSPWFHKTAEYRNRWADNTVSTISYQESTGTMYLVTCFGFTGWGTPVFSYNPYGILDMSFSGYGGPYISSGASGYSAPTWRGFLLDYYGGIVDNTTAYAINSMIFSPDLPYADLSSVSGFSGYSQSYGMEGIVSAAIDEFGNSGTDYHLYTVEFFASRATYGNVPSVYGYDTYLSQGLPNYVARYVYPKQRVAGVGDGTANQTFTVSGLHLPIPNLCAIILVGGGSWEIVSDFSTYSADAFVCKLNYSTGLITFGDGVHGAECPDGASVVVFVTLGQHGQGYSGVSGISGLSGEGGLSGNNTYGTWVFDTIIGSQTEFGYYNAIQARSGYAWWQSKDPAFEVASVSLDGNVSIDFTGSQIVTLMDNAGSPSSGFSQVPTGTDTSNLAGVSGTPKVSVSCSWIISATPRYSGTFAKVVQLQSFQQQSDNHIFNLPFIASDDPSSFQAVYDNSVSAISGYGIQGALPFYPIFLSDEGNYFTGSNVYQIVEFERTDHTRTITGSGTNIDPWIANGPPNGSLTFYLEINFLSECVSMLDISQVPGQSVLDQMVFHPIDSHTWYWTLTVGTVSWQVFENTFFYPTTTVSRIDSANISPDPPYDFVISGKCIVNSNLTSFYGAVPSSPSGFNYVVTVA